MNTFYYCVNTFRNTRTGLVPVQLCGTVKGNHEIDAVQILLDHSVIYPKGYEFLELKTMKD